MCETTDDSPHANTVLGHITDQFELEPVEAVGDTLLQRDVVEALTRDERTMIREDALEYGSVPRYDYLSPEQRDRWKAHLAQKLEKPKSEVVPDDWYKASD